MNASQPIPRTLWSRIRFPLNCWVITLLAVWPQLTWPAAGQAEPPGLELKVDDSVLSRDAMPAFTFAPVVNKVAPSVVSILSTKKVRNMPMSDWLPFLDDPRFRRFFDDGSGDDPRNRPQYRREHGLGSGVIVTKDGYILTNHHVVEGADDIQVALSDEKKQFSARVIGRDAQTDIALLKIDAQDLPVVTLADSDHLQVGDIVLALGNPFGVGQSVSHGIVSALERGGLGIEAYENFIQTDAAINPGNSGGALVDAQGRLVGINTAIATRTGASAGVGFAVPINMARRIMEQLAERGQVVRGFLGVGIQDLTEELAREFKAPNASGALVSQVEPTGAAAAAGLQSGDILVEVNGKAIADTRQLRLKIAQIAPGTEIQIKVLRQGQPKTFTATLKEMPGLAAAPGQKRESERKDEVMRDVSVTDLTPDVRRQLDIPEEVEGALVNEVAQDSAAFEAGLRVGDVIQEINRKPVHNAEEAVRATLHVPERRVLLRVWSKGSSRFLVVDESKEQ